MDNQQKSVNEMDKHELLEILWTALNKCCKNGQFTIDEAFTLKIIYDKLKDLHSF
jgi:hypothetical protein